MSSKSKKVTQSDILDDANKTMRILNTLIKEPQLYEKKKELERDKNGNNHSDKKYEDER